MAFPSLGEVLVNPALSPSSRGLMLLTPAQFTQVSSCVYEHSGVVLADESRARVSLRLMSVLAERGLDGFEGLLSLMRAPSLAREIKERVVERLIAPEAFFFARYQIFKAIRHACLPKVMKVKARSEKVLRIWAVDCGTGQDAYSLAIMLNEAVPELRDWDVRIIGTDPSAGRLSQARKGQYTASEVASGVPDCLVERSFTRMGGKWQVQSRHRRLVEFYRLHAHASWQKLCQFDLVFMRSVLSYLPPRRQAGFLSRIAEQMNPGAMLVIGANEEPIEHDGFIQAADVGGLCYRKSDKFSVAPKLAKPKKRSAFGELELTKPRDELSSKHIRQLSELVRDIDLFDGLNLKEIETICQHVELRRCWWGTAIVNEGAVSQGFYVVLEGEVRVSVGRGVGRPTIELGRLGRGDVIGEMAYILDEPCSATVRALQNVRFFFFPDALIRALLESNTTFKAHLEHLAYARRAENAKILERSRSARTLMGKVLGKLGKTEHGDGLDLRHLPRRVTRKEIDSRVMRDFAKLAREVELFRNVSIAELESFCERVALLEVPTRTTLINQGDVGSVFYIIYDGSVKVVVNPRMFWGGTEIARLRKGDIFGEMSLILNEPCSASVITRESVRVFAIGRELFEQLYLENQRFRATVDEQVEGRRRELKTLAS